MIISGWQLKKELRRIEDACLSNLEREVLLILRQRYTTSGYYVNSLLEVVMNGGIEGRIKQLNTPDKSSRFYRKHRKEINILIRRFNIDSRMNIQYYWKDKLSVDIKDKNQVEIMSGYFAVEQLTEHFLKLFGVELT